MSESWKKFDRPCPPCPHCGAELYEKFWGNGGWAKTEVGPDERMHSEVGCVIRLREIIRDKAQTIVDLAYCRLVDSRTTEENTRHDLAQIVGLGREMLAAVGVKAV